MPGSIYSRGNSVCKKIQFSVPIFNVIKEHVTQCNKVSHLCVFNMLWIAMEELRNKLYQAFVMLLGYVDNKKKVTILFCISRELLVLIRTEALTTTSHFNGCFTRLFGFCFCAAELSIVA